MIKYDRGDDLCNFIRKVFQIRGSVFPQASKVALPCAAATLALKLLTSKGLVEFLSLDILSDAAIWNGFSFLVGFLIVFRTSQAHARYWDGCTSMHKMRAEWFDGTSALISFCKYSKADKEKVSLFKHTVVRLVSMLHAVALAEIEDSNSDKIDDIEAFKFELVDVEAFNIDSLEIVKVSNAKVEMVYQWVQQYVVENIDTGVLSIPPPILSRVFQQLANGMIEFHEALKISTVPFPFPYAQTCDCLLMIYSFVTPFLVSQWATPHVWACIFSFILVFILWALRDIATEIENPFGSDANDLDARDMQSELNALLRVMVSTEAETTPFLVHDWKQRDLYTNTTFIEAWERRGPKNRRDSVPIRSFRSKYGSHEGGKLRPSTYSQPGIDSAMKAQPSSFSGNEPEERIAPMPSYLESSSFLDPEEPAPTQHAISLRPDAAVLGAKVPKIEDTGDIAPDLKDDPSNEPPSTNGSTASSTQKAATPTKEPEPPVEVQQVWPAPRAFPDTKVFIRHEESHSQGSNHTQGSTHRRTIDVDQGAEIAAGTHGGSSGSTGRRSKSPSNGSKLFNLRFGSRSPSPEGTSFIGARRGGRGAKQRSERDGSSPPRMLSPRTYYTQRQQI